MAEHDRRSEFVPDPDDSDDVEIVEVVGLDEEAGAGPERSAPRSGGDGDRSPNEYLLDLDSPDGDRLTESGAAAGGTDDGEVSDHQRLLRARADYDNLRKRIDRERRDFEQYANYALVGRLLPVVDNLERALQAGPGPGDTMREGLEMIYRQLMEQLQQEGLSPIQAVGLSFDPNLHDAVATDSTSERPANTVIEELQKGYLFQDRVLRPAAVRVSTAQPPDAEPPDGDADEDR
jgi:molecular chaperone GrpE